MTLVKALLVIGFAAVVAAVVALLVLDAPLEYVLDCDRFSGTCTFTQRFLAHSRVGRARIAALEEAEVRVPTTGRGNPPMTVWIRSRGGDWFFADYTRRAEAQEAVKSINAFLRDPSDGRFVLTRSVRAMYWIAWAFVPVVAGLIVLLAAVLFSNRKTKSPPLPAAQ